MQVERHGGYSIHRTRAFHVSSMLEQLRYFIPELPLTGWTSLALSVPVMALPVLCTYLVASMFGYPLPFTVSLLSVPWAMLMAAALWLHLRAFLRAFPQRRKELLQFLAVMVCQVSLVFIYPAYNAVFYVLPSSAQALFALVLPLIKLAEKNFICLFMRHMDDLKPEHIIFNVEIFNALFIACCMQNANSIATNVVLVGVDFTMACISLRDLDLMLNEVHRVANNVDIGTDELKEAVLLLCQQYPQFERQATSKRQPKAPQSSFTTQLCRPLCPSGAVVPIDLPHLPSKLSCDPMDASSTELAKSAVAQHARSAPILSGLHRSDKASTSAKCGAKIQHDLFGNLTPMGPTPGSVVDSTRTIIPDRKLPAAETTRLPEAVETCLATKLQRLSEEERVRFLQLMLQTLHLTEYLLLIEYVEVMIPIVYSIYLVVLFHLPNRAYYPQLRDMDDVQLRNTIGKIMMNAVLEFVSLLLLIRVLRRKLHASPLQQLAFVLDRQWRMVQSKVVLWVVVTLQSTLYHLGADYSFRFVWLQQGQAK